MPALFLRLLGIAMNFLISLWFFFFLANRIISILKDSGIKSIVIVFCFLSLMGISIVCSVFCTHIVYFYIQIGITFVFGTGEIYQALLRSYYSSSKPVNRISYYDSLFKPVTTWNVKFYEYAIRIKKWKGKPLTIAHISDIHISEKEDIGYYESISRKLAGYAVDYVFLTGDLSSDHRSYPFLGPALSKLCGPYKTFAVFGNHDYWVDAGRIAEIIQGGHINLLKNNYVDVAVDSHFFIVSGFDKPWGPDDYTTHSFPRTGDSMHLCLSHNPDNIYELSQQNTDIVFSGHYHSGEIRLPFFGALIVPSRYGRRFTHGHFLVKGTHLFVTAGAGSAMFRTRIYCNPDIFIIRINNGL